MTLIKWRNELLWTTPSSTSRFPKSPCVSAIRWVLCVCCTDAAWWIWACIERTRAAHVNHETYGISKCWIAGHINTVCCINIQDSTVCQCCSMLLQGDMWFELTKTLFFFKSDVSSILCFIVQHPCSSGRKKQCWLEGLEPGSALFGVP